MPESANPKEPISVGDMTVRIEGELVPVVDIELGPRMTVYFEHHILLWKQPQVRLGFMGLQNAGKRFFAGLQIFISTAQGPGNIAMSREAPGQIVALKLRPGQIVDVREHQFLMATNTVAYDFYWQQGLANVFFSRSGLFIDRFTASNDEGLLLLHGYGNVFEKQLAPGEQIDVEPGAWLWKDASVRMDTVSRAAVGRRRRFDGRARRVRRRRVADDEPFHRPGPLGAAVDDVSRTGRRRRAAARRLEQHRRRAGKLVQPAAVTLWGALMSSSARGSR